MSHVIEVHVTDLAMLFNPVDYDWWPILADARRFDRLATMPVRIVDGQGNPASPH